MKILASLISVLIATGCGADTGDLFKNGPGDKQEDAGPPEDGAAADAETADAAPPDQDAGSDTGGRSSMGGDSPRDTGGHTAAGGRSSTGGRAATGGTPVVTGGTPGTGGAPNTGGVPPSECAPHAMRCDGSQQQTCNESGEWGVPRACEPCVQGWVSCCYQNACNCVSSAALCEN